MLNHRKNCPNFGGQKTFQRRKSPKITFILTKCGLNEKMKQNILITFIFHNARASHQPLALRRCDTVATTPDFRVIHNWVDSIAAFGCIHCIQQVRAEQFADHQILRITRNCLPLPNRRLHSTRAVQIADHKITSHSYKRSDYKCIGRLVGTVRTNFTQRQVYKLRKLNQSISIQR